MTFTGNTAGPALLCGIPACGKSSYGRWLEREKRIAFVDVEEDGELQSAGLEEHWSRLFADLTHASEFANAVFREERQVVLGWGFPVEYLPVVSALRNSQIDVWWLDGDRDAARESFLRRGSISVELYDRQIANIEAHWPEIASLFGTERIIRVVAPGPTYLAPAEIYARMFTREPAIETISPMALSSSSSAV